MQTDEIYIIFGGPSLKDFDFSKLDNKATLACNKCAEIYNADCVISVDPTYINTRKDFLKNYNGYVAIGYRATDMGDNKKPSDSTLSHINPDYLYWHDKKHPDKMSDDPYTLYGSNTGHAAINFAVLQGFKTIHLLGLDLNKRGHWHGGYSHSRQNEQWLNDWAMMLDNCKEYLDNKGVKMINYNKKSGVRSYPFSDYREFEVVA